MKIGIDARAAIWYRGTGIGTYTFQILNNLGQIDKTSKYSLFWPGEEGQGMLQPAANFTFDRVGENRDRFWEEVHIPARLADEGMDLYHVPQNGIGLPTTKTCTFMVTIHDLIPYVMPETVGKGYLKVFLTEMPRIVEMADHIITVSKFSKRDLKRYFNLPDEKIAVVYLAAEDMYRPLDKVRAKEFMAEKYGTGAEYVLYVGGFSPRKNVKGLIRAYSRIHKELGRDVDLVIAGKHVRAFEELVRTADELGISHRVKFPGFIPVEEMPLLYNAASLFVYPSFYEGFGLDPLEAMACGVPVVCSRATSLPEVIGDGAWMVDPYRDEQLGEAMFKLLTNNDLAAEYAERGLMQASVFSWRRTSWETLQVYRAVAGSTG